jgi:hypothetical protein
MLAREAAEANAAADAARTAERERRSAIQAATDQSAWEQARRRSIWDLMMRKIHKLLSDQCVETQHQVQQDRRDQNSD